MNIIVIIWMISGILGTSYLFYYIDKPILQITLGTVVAVIMLGTVFGFTVAIIAFFLFIADILAHIVIWKRK